MTSLRCSRKRFANLPPVSPMYTVDGARQAINHVIRDAGKCVVIVDDELTLGRLRQTVQVLSLVTGQFAALVTK